MTMTDVLSNYNIYVSFSLPSFYFHSGVITGIYTTNSVDSTKYVLEKSGANIVVVDDAKQMEKVRQIKKHMPHLKVIAKCIEKNTDTMYTQIASSDMFQSSRLIL